jgi:uncharacterized protein
MTAARDRTWRFGHPDFDVAEGAPGLRLSAQGRIELAEQDAAVRQAILLLLSTLPGERVMRPAYGCNLQRLIFSPNDDTTAGLAIHYVRQALERWEPRIDLLRLDALRNDGEPGRLDIVLEYRVRATRRTDSLVFPVDLTGAPL